ncbi:unnamed protein product [Prorocentrum cordatum]|uniref:Uncharacterized protein n=1 Tax=Prorocentrum cordatum TaxID=2364126 RepID=A0ABN9S6Y4_9DINO|nr:unnamed protein product [Polarella glacialis]
MPSATVGLYTNYIQEKVNPIFESMVAAVLLQQPQDPAEFMVGWLLRQDQHDRGEFALLADANEIARLTQEVERLRRLKAELQESLRAQDAPS